MDWGWYTEGFIRPFELYVLQYQHFGMNVSSLCFSKACCRRFKKSIKNSVGFHLIVEKDPGECIMIRDFILSLCSNWFVQ